MEKIAQKYSIGIEAMDAQHARWIELIERFRSVGAEHILDEPGRVAAGNAIAELLDYTRSHFASEEKFIAEHGYPDLENHKKIHCELEVEVRKLQQEIGTVEHPGTPLKLNLFITVWLMEHIMQEDLKYARFILGKRLAT